MTREGVLTFFFGVEEEEEEEVVAFRLPMVEDGLELGGGGGVSGVERARTGGRFRVRIAPEHQGRSCCIAGAGGRKEGEGEGGGRENQ